jgi:hypothetical protein
MNNIRQISNFHNFIAPGAPRGVWFSLNWQFDPNAKPNF